MTDDELLQQYAHPSEAREGEWYLTFENNSKPAGELAAFIRAQLTLGVKVTDVFEMSAWVALVDRLVAAERRIAEIEAGR